MTLSLNDILAAQVDDLKTRYRMFFPLLKRVLQDHSNESQSRLLLDRLLQSG